MMHGRIIVPRLQLWSVTRQPQTVSVSDEKERDENDCYSRCAGLRHQCSELGPSKSLILKQLLAHLFCLGPAA